MKISGVILFIIDFINSKDSFYFVTVPSSNDLCMMNSDYTRTCFRDLGMVSFKAGNSQCQALRGNLPVVNKSAVMTFLANKFEQFWMSLKTDRLVFNCLSYYTNNGAK